MFAILWKGFKKLWETLKHLKMDLNEVTSSNNILINHYLLRKGNLTFDAIHLLQVSMVILEVIGIRKVIYEHQAKSLV
jgi:hypothetical protein